LSNDMEPEMVGEAIVTDYQLFGKNPNRSRALKEIWYEDMMREVDEEDMPEEAKRELTFLMSVNALMDMIMEIIPEELGMDLSCTLDSFIGVQLVNKRYSTDLMKYNLDTLRKVKREDYATEEEFVEAVEQIDERWWTTQKQGLGGRSPNEAIKDEMQNFNLDKAAPGPRTSFQQ
jgi:hypothetical protein